MNKKYQVFISSTFEDLKEERETVIETLLNKNCIPVGMEYFPAANDEQMTIIKHLIDECDYYVLILGGKYGSIEPKTHKSYTQLEYEYAVEKGVPISAFYIADKNKLPYDKVEHDHIAEMENFLHVVKSSRMCKSWNNADDLAGKVSISLDYQIKNYIRPGWVRANKISSEEANNTLIQLKEENNKLKEQIKFLSSSAPRGTECYQQGEDLFTIHYELPSFTSPWGGDDENGNRCFSIKKTWNEIFLSICTILLKPVVENTILERIEEMLLPEYGSINDNDFQTIIIQLMALKLITADVMKSEYDGGVYTYWVLSPYGRVEMVRLKALRKESIS